MNGIVRPLRLLLALATLALAACGGGSSAAADGDTWAVLGSSTAAGVGANPGLGWASRLATEAPLRPARLDNLALSGLSSPQARPAAAAASGRPAPDPAHNVDRAIALRPALVLLSFPTNDAVLGIPADETAGHIATIRQTALDAGARVMVLGIQPRNGFSADQRSEQTRLDTSLRALAGACFVPLFDALADTQGDIAAIFDAGDGVHLNDAGHGRILEQVTQVLQGGSCVPRPGTSGTP